MVESGGPDLSTIGMGIGTILLGAWAVYEKWTRYKAETAAYDSSVAESRANEALFNMLTVRLEALEEEVRLLRAELSKEKEYTRILVDAMIRAGITPPAYPA